MAKKELTKIISKPAPKAKFKYLCPACTNVAIESSNKMMGVKITCKVCGKEIVLNELNRWVKI